MSQIVFLHSHPYDPFVPANADRLIVGTLPPPRFTTRELLPGDVDFCYGSRDGLLWPVLERVFNTSLQYENTREAAVQRKQFLADKGIGIFDMVDAAHRKKIDASDLGMEDVKLRDLTGALAKMEHVKALLFTGGNSKNGPEYFFRRHLRSKGMKMEQLTTEVPRVHRLVIEGRELFTVSLTAPSGSANRAIGSMQSYKMTKATNPAFTTLDFRVQQYTPYFTRNFWEDLQ